MFEPIIFPTDNTVASLVGKLSKPGTAGSVTVNQSWTSNFGGNKFQSQTNASKSWGKPGAMSTLLGRPIVLHTSVYP